VGWTLFFAVLSRWLSRAVEPPATLHGVQYVGSGARTRLAEEAMGIVLEFRELLSETPPDAVRSAVDLPYPKHTIKQALIFGLKVTRDPGLRGHLQEAFLRLSQWKEHESVEIEQERQALFAELEQRELW
jgi:hypothetical protein